MTPPPDCIRCSNTGWIVIRAGTLAYVGPAPSSHETDPPAPGFLEVRCKACDRAWTHVYEFKSAPRGPL